MKIKNLKNRRSQQQVAMDIEQNNAANAEEPLTADKQTIDDLCDFMKKCFLPNDKTQLILKLQETVDVRRRDLHNQKNILAASIHLYTIDAELVCICLPNSNDFT